VVHCLDVAPAMKPLLRLLERYREAFRDEPKLRAYAVASFVDDVGIAVSAWATMLLVTNLFTTRSLSGLATLIGLLQVGLVMVLACVGGRRLWRFGLFEPAEGAPPQLLLPREEASA
jgi:hypothetical protein